ncbi:MAG: ATP-binding protein [Syntrophales bacterium]|nr:ATP-binding protein [Syntrophales bacterium]
MQIKVLDELLIQHHQLRLEEIADSVNNFYEHFPTRKGLSALDLTLKEQIQLDERLARIDVLTKHRGGIEYVAGAGRVAYDWPEETIVSVVEKMKPQFFKIDTEAGAALGILSPTLSPKDNSIHIVGVVSFSQWRKDLLAQTRKYLIISSSILLLVVVTLIILTFDWLIGKPLKSIINVIDEFQKGNYNPRIDSLRKDEIGLVAEHFNIMAEEINRVISRNEELTKHLRNRVQEETFKVAQLQQEVSQLQQLAAMGHLVANLTHDIGTPIHSIRGFAQLLLEKGEWSPDVKRKLELIEQQAERIHLTVQNIKKMTRVPEPHFETTTVENLLHDTLPLVEPHIQKAGIKLTVNFEEGMPPLLLDRYRIQTAILNLIQNAVEALKTGGEIKISAQKDEYQKAVVFKVQDNGPGIEPHLLEKVSEPFFSTHKDEGVRGLGLAIVNDIMKSHGGKMHIQSKPGEGTEVSLILPIADSQKLT